MILQALFILVYIGISSAVTLNVYTSMNKERIKSLATFSGKQIEKDLKGILGNSDSWNQTKSNNSSFSCLGTSCNHGESNLFKLYDLTGSEYFDPTTQGFTAHKSPCAITGGNPTFSCPIAAQLRYEFACPSAAATCSNPNIKVSLNFKFDPSRFPGGLSKGLGFSLDSSQLGGSLGIPTAKSILENAAANNYKVVFPTNYFKHVNGSIYPGAAAAPMGSSITLALTETECDAIPELQINKVMIDSAFNLKVIDGSSPGSTICTFNSSTGKCISSEFYTTHCAPGLSYLFKTNIEFIATPEGVNIMSIHSAIYRNGFFYWSN